MANLKQVKIDEDLEKKIKEEFGVSVNQYLKISLNNGSNGAGNTNNLEAIHYLKNELDALKISNENNEEYLAGLTSTLRNLNKNFVEFNLFLNILSSHQEGTNDLLAAIKKEQFFSNKAMQKIINIISEE